MGRKAHNETASQRQDREILKPWRPTTKTSYQPAAPRPDTSPERQLSLDLDCTSSDPDLSVSIPQPLPTRAGQT